VNAFRVVELLQADGFYERGWDPVDLLRQPEHYIRFHATKAKRLLEARSAWPEIAAMLASSLPPTQEREWLVQHVNGFGYKEASHFLRNIGRRGLAIIDRHLLTNLVACGVYARVPDIGTKKRYIVVERRFQRFATRVGLDMDVLDLLFWSEQAGLILK
jgi:N-glycosylase/DNA lyase